MTSAAATLACLVSVFVASASPLVRSTTAAAAPVPQSAPQQAPPAEAPAAQDPPKAGAPDPAADADKDKDKQEKANKNTPVTLRGCVHGSMLDGVESEKTIEGLTATIRLLSKRELRKQLKEVDGYQVEATGILKLPPKSPLSKKFGRTTVSVGVGNPRNPQNRPMSSPQMEYGTLDLLSFHSLEQRCETK